MIRTSAFVGPLITLFMATAAWPLIAANDLRSVRGSARNLEEMIWGTRLCMREAISTQLVQGVRDSAEIMTFTQSVCGDGLSAFMRTNMQRPAAEVAAFLEGMVYMELDRFPGIVRSSGPSNLPKNRDNSDIYVISTFKSGQSIDVRKADVAELRDAGIAMAGALRKTTPGQDQLVSTAKDMAEKDRCFNLHAAMVALSFIEAGTLNAPSHAREFLRNSIASIEAVNSQTQITCQVR